VDSKNKSVKSKFPLAAAAENTFEFAKEAIVNYSWAPLIDIGMYTYLPILTLLLINYLNFIGLATV